jgi:hypothetical protein
MAHMRVSGPMSRTAVAVTLVTLSLTTTLAAGCTGAPPVIDKPDPSRAPTTPADPQGRVAALAATAQDHRFVATYTLATTGRAARTMLVAVAADGTWRVDVPGGALTGTADVAMVGVSGGVYQCIVGGSATQIPTPDPSASTAPRPFVAPGCVRVGATNRDIPKKYDPVFEHLFTDWLGVLTDRDAPIDVGASTSGPRVTGACFSVQPSSASLAPAMSPGVYCFAPDGTLTGAKISAGTITIDRDPVPAPPTTTLPGPVKAGPAAPVNAPDGA